MAKRHELIPLEFRRAAVVEARRRRKAEAKAGRRRAFEAAAARAAAVASAAVERAAAGRAAAERALIFAAVAALERRAAAGVGAAKGLDATRAFAVEALVGEGGVERQGVLVLARRRAVGEKVLQPQLRAEDGAEFESADEDAVRVVPLVLERTQNRVSEATQAVGANLNRPPTVPSRSSWSALRARRASSLSSRRRLVHDKTKFSGPFVINRSQHENTHEVRADRMLPMPD